ncbi:peptidase inhibitor family I36 protein [Streptomyces sp. NBC_01808]|uniref:peptidase inhibitor family I36 protein n=1 Tax=Streptomyces sp. NBC_01808 TaxID=2975947 RepID=UPI002DDBED85|nr:peptidase inhibitor family I36 protein [Streptomyces sp. NBC_01808]WSA39522.1 peptidase inhibitor family I36 protein [Streptomyces sp. NBC_01808]
MRRILTIGALSATLAAGTAPAIADSYPKGDGFGAPGSDIGVTAFSDCPEGRLCLWDNQEGGGLRLAALTPPGDWSLTSASVNRANSIWNRTGRIALLEDKSCKVVLRIDPGQKAPDLGSIDRIGCDGSWNNKIDNGWFV